MNRNDTEQHENPRDDALMARVRDRLDRDSGLSAEEAQRLAQGRREAFERRRRRPSRMPAYGLAVAASVMLVAGLLLMRPDGLEPLPAQLAQLDDLELLLVLEEGDAGADPEFLAWALEERG
ncbi:hypothetical protein [Thioalkalivibrio sulfidiphilus]|uniref:hypothetical protein n=1 Tax=Thioalkalivibrio sulfidiphilus TaxID=1033854 RepID=UPI0003635DB9|nr:hypothetical protein [Thioalkalivibrio sulfidiphilus]